VVALRVRRSPAPPSMPIQLDYDIARDRFKDALALARSQEDLPQEWILRTSKVGQAPSKTFIAMLGTALLAKATDQRVDPFSLKTRDFATAYSARALCKDVLVPGAVGAGVHLGTTGREPLNNQPFFRYERVGLDMRVHRSMRSHLDYLCQSLGAMIALDATQALLALAAFLRVRIAEAPVKAPQLAVERAYSIGELISIVSVFVTTDPENGKRGQALVAACLDVVFDDVRTRRVNDPSRHWPGDVVVFQGERVLLAVEVKQRPASDTEILQFVERCAQMGVRRAAAALLDPAQPELHLDADREESWRNQGVQLSVFETAGEVIEGALTWSRMSVEEVVEAFPQRMASRLEELEVSRRALAGWAAFFERER